ncbi:response regulator [Paenibacillus sp. MMS20-IR301]|uniref:response regulator n=1 Tax=Paenibacillus sp. MMS20-IR301 TaxID=2895946 RepID=UPI0028E7A359|nr:response regulator [Paenibacillus sp. MMS20-IR301]WNS45186.1 response regulator [Paenibacillus sp. MMS20-IR301]
MIKALLIDDERLAIVKLEFMLNEMKTVEVAGCFTDPVQALEAAPRLSPDVIFLDIEMPELNGLMVAEQLQSICPKAMIVFLTAYNNYAVDAFELNALDYILKPVNRSRLSVTLERLEKRLEAQALLHPVKATLVHCFQSIRFEYGGVIIPNFRWRTTKAQELFAYLLHNRNRFVHRDALIELLWPDFPVKKASSLLYTTIYQVRQCLKQGEIDLQISNVSAGEGYLLEVKGLHVDVDEWEEGIQRLSLIHSGNVLEHHRLFELYIGDYMGDYDFLWAESERQRLRTIWLHHAMNIGNFYISCNKLAEAVTVYQRIVQMQPYFEQAHFGLMKIYETVGDRPAVESQYNHLSEILLYELGIEPITEITNWYETWKQGNHKNIPLEDKTAASL